MAAATVAADVEEAGCLRGVVSAWLADGVGLCAAGDGREVFAGTAAVSREGVSRGWETNDTAGLESGRDEGIDAIAGVSACDGISKGATVSMRGGGGAMVADGAGSILVGAGWTAAAEGAGHCSAGCVATGAGTETGTGSATAWSVGGGGAGISSGGGGGGGMTVSCARVAATGCGAYGWGAGGAAREPSAGSTNLPLIQTTADPGGVISSQSPLFPTTVTLSPFVNVATGL